VVEAVGTAVEGWAEVEMEEVVMVEAGEKAMEVVDTVEADALAMGGAIEEAVV